uniref:CCHC-type domain-containing protein n=1 Tax=Cacopsylla melanoneura TaxID=428564 RepID=A0A8D8Y144_9HEMI
MSPTGRGSTGGDSTPSKKPSAELTQILNALKVQGEAIQVLLQSKADSSNSTGIQVQKSVVSHNIQFEAFDPDEEDFSTYKERLENFQCLRGIREDESTKRNLLLGCLKRDVYKQLTALTAPMKPSEKTYQELVKILEQRFDSMTSVHTERHKFLSRIQGRSENLTTYIQDLKNIALKCQWVCPSENCKQNIDDIFQAQFIRGIRENFIREKILMADNTTLQQTLQLALSIESAHKQTLESYNTSEQKVQINKVSYSNVSSSRNSSHKSRSKSRAYGPSTSRYKSNSSYKSLSPPQQKSNLIPHKNLLSKLGLQNVCLRCGKSNHKASECYAKNLKCNLCNKKGHVNKVCISSRAKDIHIVYGDEVQIDDEFDIKRIDAQIYNVTSDDKLSKKIFVHVKLGTASQNFELDTGSGVSILSKTDFDKLQLDTEIKKCPNIRFRAYNKEIITPLGYVRIPITYKDKVSEETLYIVSEDFSPILGRVWIRKLNIINLQNCSKEEDNMDILQILNDDLIFNKFPHVFTEEIGEIPNVQSKFKKHVTFILPASNVSHTENRVHSNLYRQDDLGDVTPQSQTPVMPIRRLPSPCLGSRPKRTRKPRKILDL